MKRIVNACLSLIFMFSLLTFGLPQKPNLEVVHAVNLSDTLIAEAVDKKVYSRATINDNFSDNIVLVALTQKATFEFKKYTVKDFPEVQLDSVNEITEQTAEKVKRQQVTKILGQKLPAGELAINTSSYRRILELVLQKNSKNSVLRAVKLLEQREDVFCAEPAYIEKLHTSLIEGVLPSLNNLNSSPAPWASTNPNDPDLSKQWALNQIHLPQTWNVSKGSNKVLVGVIDTGISGANLDLKNRINLELSRDYTKPSPYRVSSLDAMVDVNGHGTSIAGIIGAQANNATGIAGVCWDVGLVSLRVGENGMELTRTIRAIEYATEIGLPILNYSGGGIGNYDSLTCQAIKNYPGLFVAAAGNDSLNTDINQYYPAGYRTNVTTGDRLSNIISVGATTLDNGTERRAVYPDVGWNKYKEKGSNWGSASVDIFAPGTYIRSTYSPNAIGYFSGSSNAAPFVAGVAALIKAINPEATTNQIKNQILSGSDLLEISTPNGNYLGKRVNALRAVFAQGKAYYIKNMSTGQYMTVSGSGTGTGMNVVQAGFNGGTRQQFVAWYENGGFFSLQPKFNLESSNSTRVDVTFVPLAYNLLRIQKLNHSDRQKFRVEYFNGQYRLRASGSAKTLEPLTSNNNEIHDVTIQNNNLRQYWKLIRV